MKPERWQQVNELFQAALEREPGERARFVAEACAGDELLRGEVDSLIAFHDKGGSFMERPAVAAVAANLMSDEQDQLEVGQTLGHYQILDSLGAGGMGEVYLARDTKLGRKIALKLLPAYLSRNKDRLRRFEQEARVASTISHPNVAHIYEIGEANGHRFITMEYVEGVTLRQHTLEKEPKLDRVLNIATQVADALGAAHGAGIVHRDIKPENIMVRPDGYIKVLDFGLAKQTDLSASSVDTKAPTRAMVKTEPGIVMGTASYMSPEQARGLSVDARTDIWSLGVVLYEMIASRLPFEGATSSDVISLILQKEPLTLLGYAPETPVELERIVAKALTKDKEERYQTAKDLLIDLRRLRQRLQVEAELERTAPPEISNPTVRAPGGGQAGIDTNKEPAARSTSSAEYLISGIKHHRRSAVLALLIFVIAMAAIAYVYYPRNNKAAINSIAVMPFINTSADPNTEYLSDGITESLINSLSQIPHLRMISRSSVFRYKGREIDPQKVASELGAQAILMGRVVEHGENLSISVELVDASDNTHIWGEQYNRRLSDILTIQGEISQAITERLRLKLSGDEQQRLTKRYTDNTEAYQLYLQGRYYWNKRTGEGLKKSRSYYEQAIAKDPGYALAYAGLADSYIVSAAVLPPGEKYPKTKAAALKALEIDNSLAEPHAALARVIFEYDRDFAGAEKEFQQATKMNPNYATAHQYYALFLAAMGRSGEALREAQRAQGLDPISLNINVTLGNVHKFARRYDQAVDQFKKIIEMDQNWPNAHAWLAETYELKGMNDEAVNETLNYLTLTGAKPETVAALRAAYTAFGVKGFWRKQLDMLIEQSRQTYVPPVDFAAFYARLGEKDKAFEWLEKAYQEHDANLPYLKVSSPLDSLRSDPRFTDLVRRVGLTP